jgi:hypothetical protein
MRQSLVGTGSSTARPTPARAVIAAWIAAPDSTVRIVIDNQDLEEKA